MACAAVVAAATTAGACAPGVSARLSEARVPSGRPALLALRPRSSKLVANKSRVVMSAAPQKEWSLAGTTTAAALVAAAVIPEIAEAATPGVSPSLKNLLLSVVAGGVIAGILGIAVAGVSTFDPVKRR